MASVHEYKRFENKLVQKVKDAAIVFVMSIAGIFKGLGKFLTRRYTIVFVPHSEKKVYNLHINVLSICCFLFVVFGILGAFFYYGASYNTTMNTIAVKNSRLQNAEASLDLMIDETNLLFGEARKFQVTLSNVLSALGSNVNNKSHNTASDLSSILNIRDTSSGMLREVDELRQLSAFLSNAADPLKGLDDLLASMGVLLTEVPSIWPIRNGMGHISMYFGQNTNPFTGQYYLHRGIDLSTYRSGDPVVATADGKVVTVEYDSGYGNYVVVQHKHGYYTRYAHMLSFAVRVGQRVQQNEVIGYIGNTGISTGPHLHYEVQIGSDVVDPYKYITIRSKIARQGR